MNALGGGISAPSLVVAGGLALVGQAVTEVGKLIAEILKPR